MLPEKRVLIKFKNGTESMFACEGIEEFHQLVEEVSKWGAGWIYVGSEAAIRKKEIVGIYFIGETPYV